MRQEDARGPQGFLPPAGQGYAEGDGGEDGGAGFRAPQRKSDDVEGGRRKRPSPLDFPPLALSGWCGDWAREYGKVLEVPEHAFFMAALTCLGSVMAGRVRLDSELRTDSRLYTVILGLSGAAKKSTAMDKATEFFRETLRTFRMCEGVGSAEGLAGKLDANRWDRRLLLCFDEFQHFANKCKIESSVLLQMVNTLFEKNRYENLVKNKPVRLEEVYLAFLSASTIDTYDDCWDSAMTSIGLRNRIFVVPARGERRHSVPRAVDGEVKAELAERLRDMVERAETVRTYEMEKEGWEYYDRWYRRLGSGRYSVRVDTYALRLMPLLTFNDGKDVVDLETVMKATLLCDWQMLVRKKYDPVMGDTMMARVENKIRRVLGLAGKGGMATRDVMRAVHSDRCGVKAFNMALDALRANGEVEYMGGHRWTITKAGEEADRDDGER